MKIIIHLDLFLEEIINSLILAFKAHVTEGSAFIYKQKNIAVLFL